MTRNMMPMRLDARQCPEDGEAIAEAYVEGSLDEIDATAFEEHLLICPACRDHVAEADQYDRAMREAARRIRGAAE